MLTYGRCWRMWASIVPMFVLTEPEDVHAVLSSARHTDKIFVYRMLRGYLGTGLLTSDSSTWLRHRRLIQPAFHSRFQAHVVAEFAKAAAAAMENLRPLADGVTDINLGAVANEFVLRVQHGVFCCSVYYLFFNHLS